MMASMHKWIVSNHKTYYYHFFFIYICKYEYSFSASPSDVTRKFIANIEPLKDVNIENKSLNNENRYVYIHVWIYVHIYISMYIYVHVYMYISMYMYIYTYMCIFSGHHHQEPLHLLLICPPQYQWVKVCIFEYVYILVVHNYVCIHLYKFKSMNICIYYQIYSYMYM
jgi:hypothetical protein